MKKYLFLFIAFCLAAVAVPDIYGILPASLRAEADPGQAAESRKSPRYAVECLCGGEKITLPLEEYVCRVLLNEGYEDYPAETVKAAACVVRTRAMTGVIAAPDVVREIPQNVVSAVKETENMYIAYGGEPINAVTHRSSYLRTVSAAEAYGTDTPYLVSVSTPEKAPELVKTFSPDELEKILTSNGYKCDNTLRLNGWLTYVARSETGRVSVVWLCGNSISGNKLAQMLGLDSTCFDLSVKDGAFVAVCRGSGDGVGMSVLGARAMAESGASFYEILVHYFKGVDVLLNNAQ